MTFPRVFACFAAEAAATVARRCASMYSKEALLRALRAFKLRGSEKAARVLADVAAAAAAVARAAASSARATLRKAAICLGDNPFRLETAAAAAFAGAIATGTAAEAVPEPPVAAAPKLAAADVNVFEDIILWYIVFYTR
jgi:hypothetical protein